MPFITPTEGRTISIIGFDVEERFNKNIYYLTAQAKVSISSGEKSSERRRGHRSFQLATQGSKIIVSINVVESLGRKSALLTSSQGKANGGREKTQLSLEPLANG